MSLPFRQIHLDFHTSEAIPEVGKYFNSEEFIDAMQMASVDSVTLFAKCIHGWSYYPTKIGSPHPNLSRPDLLGEMVAACRQGGIGVCVYLAVQWDELTAREHPEWRVIRGRQRGGDDAEMDQLSPQWHPLSLANKALVDCVIAQACEVVDHYDPDGIFMDVLMTYDDVSQAALDRMRKLNLDPNCPEDRALNERGYIMDYCKRFHEAVCERKPNIRIFHNNGHISKNERDRWKFSTHLELESLPTGGWGYDHFPVSAAYASTLGMEYLGMTGKFHSSWGEFGGYKRSIALEYECALMVAMGARCSVGDQLHPGGRIDRDTYGIIAPAYHRVRQLEPYLDGAVLEAEVAVFSAEGHYRARDHEASDYGAARMLLELQIPFAVIDKESDFSLYRLIILPDVITLEEVLKVRFQNYLEHGGRLILSGNSGMTPAMDAFALPLRASVNGMSAFSPDYLAVKAGFDADLVESPFVMYQRACQIHSEGAEVIGQIHEPYFNRTWEHFCSHKHAPHRLDAHPDAAGILRDRAVIYFAHPLFRMYHAIGQPLYKYLFRGAIRALLPQRHVEVTMPSSGRINLLWQEHEKRWILHLLFAQTQLRGHAIKGWYGERPIEIIEDIVPIYGVQCRMILSSVPKRVYEAYSSQDIPFEYADGKVTLVVEKVDLHAVVVIEE